MCAASTSLGIPNPVCIPHVGTSLVRSAPEEDDDDADTAQRGDEVDPFGQNVSKIVQQGSFLRFEIRFIKFNLTSRAYQTKLSPLEGLARPRALYHDRHPMVRSKGPPVRGPLPCRRAQS